jgi:hypothetical protein
VRASPGVSVKLIRPIDVANLCFKEFSDPTPGSLRYVALSYVRGANSQKAMLKKENMTALCRPGALSLSSVPKTIADAMSLVLNMGEHFLWVGSLCIIQDDIKDKRTQIP